MTARREYRHRDDIEIEVLDALVDRREEGMTVFEIRSRVEADIDEIETALAALKRDDLIVVEEEERPTGGRPVVKPVDAVVPSEDADAEPSLFDQLRERLPF